MLFFGGSMLLRLVAALALLIVLVVVALLVHASAAHLELALAFGLRRNVCGLCVVHRTARIRHVFFFLQNAKLLFVCLFSLHRAFLIWFREKPLLPPGVP